MRVVVCLDNSFGMMFNKRRQSRDRYVVSDIISLLNGEKLFMSRYSFPLFEKTGYEDIVVRDDFLDACGACDTAFVEDRRLLSYEDGIETMITYMWNRDYPSDTRLDLIPEGDGWQLTETFEFPGYSHDLITRNTYVRV